MSPRRYFIVTLVTTLAAVTAVWCLALWLQPLHGDLTRIGGFSERDYGGNEPMQEFRSLAVTFGAYNQPVDILVIGDSFANAWPHQQWQNWLAQKTGWRIHTLNINKVDLNALVTSTLYRRFPPKVVVWNVVERDLLDEYGRDPSTCNSDVATVAVQSLDRHPTTFVPVTSHRPRFAGLNPGFVRIWVWHTLSRKLFGINTSDALSFRLARDDLFSSRVSNELLVYRNDLRKAHWRPSDLTAIRCGFADLAARIQANGVTRLVTAIAPDKSSAYRPWLASPSNLPESHLPDLLKNFPVPDARLDTVLAIAIASGTKDVYMPNDTHWNATGQKLVAEAVLEVLTAGPSGKSYRPKETR